MEETEVRSRIPADPRKEIGIQTLAPRIQCGGVVGEQVEVVQLAIAPGKLTSPQCRRGGAGPKGRQRRHLGWLVQPLTRDASSGWALVGEKRDKPPVAQLARRAKNGISIVIDRSPVKGPDPSKNALAQWMMRRPSDANGVGTEVIEKAGQPLPVPVMHRKKKGRGTLRGPDGVQGGSVRNFQVVPSTLPEPTSFGKGIQKQGPAEVRRNLAKGRGGKGQDVRLSGDG